MEIKLTPADLKDTSFLCEPIEFSNENDLMEVFATDGRFSNFGLTINGKMETFKSIKGLNSRASKIASKFNLIK